MIYLDHAASTPCDPRVIEAMLPWFDERNANASSPHAKGKQAARAVGQARQQIAELLGVEPPRVVFTSGATEALNAALTGIAALAAPERRTLLISPTEHKAVLDTAAHLAKVGAVDLEYLPVTSSGAIDLSSLEGLVGRHVLAVVAMAANNETGVLSPVGSLANAAHSVGGMYLCDATQAAGKIPLALSADRVDLAAVSAHKFGGPQGIGALIVPTSRPPAGWTAHTHGGGHERGWRSGTSNLAGAVGLGEAARLAQEEGAADASRMRSQRDTLEKELSAQLRGTVHCAGWDRLPNITSIRLPGCDAEAMIATTPRVAFAAGSACTSAVPQPSHVLTAMGVTPTVADETLRLSVGRGTTDEDVARAVAEIVQSGERLREMGA